MPNPAPFCGCDTAVNLPLNDISAIVRAQRLRDMLASIEEFWRASDEDRRIARRAAMHDIAQFRRAYLAPERAAFAAAVAASNRRKAA